MYLKLTTVPGVAHLLDVGTEIYKGCGNCMGAVRAYAVIQTYFMYRSTLEQIPVYRLLVCVDTQKWE